MLARIHITNLIVDDEKSARAWGHCFILECQARVSCELSWQPNHITCFRKNVHHPQELPRYDRRVAQNLEATFSHNSPLRASAALVGRKLALLPCDQPTYKVRRQARWRFLHKQLARKVSPIDGALAWQRRLAERVAFNSQQKERWVLVLLSLREGAYMVATSSLYPGFQLDSTSWFVVVYVSACGRPQGLTWQPEA